MFRFPVNTIFGKVSRYVFLSLCAGLCMAVLMLPGCRKSAAPDNRNNDTIAPPPPPPPPPDTISLVRRLEERYVIVGGGTNQVTRRFSFYYDAAKRVTATGIKHVSLGSVLFDTATCRFFYTGASLQPSMIIAPNRRLSQAGAGTVVYDTTYLFYDGGGKLVKDSTNDREYNAGTLTPRTLVRQYSYGASYTLTLLYTKFQNSAQLLYRKDSVVSNGDGTLQLMEAVFDPNGLSPVKAKVEGFTHSGYVNPLGKLNISGLAFTRWLTPNINEILGYHEHQAVSGYNNAIPYYIDMISQKLPTLFYNGAFNRLNMQLYGQTDGFGISITPWTVRNTYPETIIVTASTSLPGTQMQYRYGY
jgi:hypothetical protein